MIRSLDAWYSDSPGHWTTTQERYRRHLKAIGRDMPPRLKTFVHRYTLHDDHFAGVQVVSSVPSRRDALVTIHLYRDGVSGTAALLVVHFIGVHGSLTNIPLSRDIMFFDVEAVGVGIFKMSFVVDERRTWSVRFRDLDFYVHEYPKNA